MHEVQNGREIAVRSAAAFTVVDQRSDRIGMLAALRGLQARQGAHFVDYQGNEIPW